MKKHILSNYIKKVKMLVEPSVDDTVLTESTETSDPDEFRCHATLSYNHDPDKTMTHSIETSDPDELRLDTTNETRSTETSDPDEFCVSNKFYDGTRTTFTLEQGDPDEFALL